MINQRPSAGITASMLKLPAYMDISEKPIKQKSCPTVEDLGKRKKKNKTQKLARKRNRK